MRFIFFLASAFLIFAALIFEATIISVPFIFLICAFMLTYFRQTGCYVVVFLLAATIDSLRVTNLGVTPLALAGLIAFIVLFERYTGSKDKLVSGFIILTSSLIYSHYLSYSMTATLIFILLFAGFFAGIGILNRNR